jgi:hypothetical protein
MRFWTIAITALAVLAFSPDVSQAGVAGKAGVHMAR